MISELHAVSEAAFLNSESFGECGAYVRIAGIALGRVDPHDPANSNIAGLDKAKRNPAGQVEYKTPFVVLRPMRPERGNGCVLYEATNRGKTLIFPYLFDALTQSNTLDRLEHLGNAMPLRSGFTLAWCGWDANAVRQPGTLVLDAPLASDAGTPLVRVIREEFVSGTRHGTLDHFQLSYDAATLDPAHTTLSVRQHAWDAPRRLGSDAWRYVDKRRIVLLPEGRALRAGWLYDVHYPATNPRVLPLGYAATRDLVSFLRYDAGALRIVGGPIRDTLAIGVSQAGRYLRAFVGKGFNRDEAGRRVFNGMLAHIAGIGCAFFDDLFAQPFRTRTQHQDHDYPENEFPFSTALTTDPVSGRSAALLADSACDPLFMQTNTSSEYWQKGASLLHTDPSGERDVELPRNSRVYLIAGTQHDARPGLGSEAGNCANPCNPHDPSPVLRALFQALYQWIRNGIAPPDSRVPRIAGATLQPASALQFPRWQGLQAVADCNDIVPPGDWVEPEKPRFRYAALVCGLDADGNERDGILTPDIAVPLGTYTGWNTYRAPYPQGVLADRRGSLIPFATSREAGLFACDPRMSLQERYPSVEVYVDLVSKAAQQLVHERLLLQHDADRYIARARAWSR